MADFVIQFFNQGYFTAKDLELFVQVQWITADQYKSTTGVNYVAG